MSQQDVQTELTVSVGKTDHLLRRTITVHIDAQSSLFFMPVLMTAEIQPYRSSGFYGWYSSKSLKKKKKTGVQGLVTEFTLVDMN